MIEPNNTELGAGIDLTNALSQLAQRLGVSPNPQGSIDADRFIAAIERHYNDITRLRDLCASKVDEIERKQSELIARERALLDREQRVYGVERLKSFNNRATNLFDYFGGKT